MDCYKLIKKLILPVMLLAASTVTYGQASSGNPLLPYPTTPNGAVQVCGSTPIGGVGQRCVWVKFPPVVGTGIVYGWGSGGTADLGLSRDSADTLDIGNGTAGDTSATVKAHKYVTDGTNGGFTLPEGDGSSLSPTTSVDLIFGSSADQRVAMDNHNGGKDLVLGQATIDILTHKTFDTMGIGNLFYINGNPILSISGNTSIVATSTSSLASAPQGTPACADGHGNVDADATRCPGGGGGGGLTGQSGSLGGSSLGAGACSSTNVTISGVTANMIPGISPLTYPGDAFYWRAYVSGTNTITVKVCAAAAGTPTTSVYNINVQPGPITAGGTWSLVQDVTNTGCLANTPCTIIVAPIGAGNVVTIGGGGAGASNTISATDGGSTYTNPSGSNIFDSTSSLWGSGLYTLNAAGGATGIVVSPSGGATNGWTASMREYHYTGATPTFDTANAVQDEVVDNPKSFPTLALAGTNDLIYVFGLSYFQSISSISSPYNTTPDINACCSSGSTASAGALAQSSGTGPTATLTGANGSWISLGIAIKGN